MKEGLTGRLGRTKHHCQAWGFVQSGRETTECQAKKWYH